MSLKAREPKSNYKPAPAGTHVARCVRVIDLGTQWDKKWEKESPKIHFDWEIPAVLAEEGMFKGMPFLVGSTYTTSLHKKAMLRRDIESWRGLQMDKEELNNFDIREMLDRPCMLSVTHAEYEDKIYANVTTVMGLAAGTECPPRVHPLVMFDVDEPDMAVFDMLPPYLQDKIKVCVEWQDAGSEKPTDKEDIPF